MLSIVIPVFNEHATIKTLRNEIEAVAAARQYDIDIVFVDDGSSDASWQQISELCATDSRVRGIRFRRNFGKAAALSAGFAAARGELVMTMDADLQDDPTEIPKFLEKINDGADVVSGWKQVRHDPWHKVGPSRVFNWLVSKMTGVVLHDHNCGLKCYRREIFREVHLYGELHRFVPVLAAARGWKVDEVVVSHRARAHGQSKYGWWRIPKGFLDLLTVKFLTGFGQRPQHVLGTAGLICFSLSLLGITALTAYWVISRLTPLEDLHLHQRAVFFYSLIALVIGSQFMLAGFLAELITAMNVRDTDTYCVAERVGGDDAWRQADVTSRADRRRDASESVDPSRREEIE
jgi:dolichol-phosphate mannosyltransferase